MWYICIFIRINRIKNNEKIVYRETLRQIVIKSVCPNTQLKLFDYFMSSLLKERYETTQSIYGRGNIDHKIGVAI